MSEQGTAPRQHASPLPQRLLRIKDVAEILNVHEVERLIREKKLIPVRIPGMARVRITPGIRLPIHCKLYRG